MLVAVCVFTMMRFIGSLATDTTRIVVAARGIERGESLDAPSMRVVEVPRSDVFRQAFTTPAQALKRVSRTAIAKGQPIYRNSVALLVEPSAGLTDVRVTLASLPGGLMPGEEVRLVSSDGCEVSEGRDPGDKASDEGPPDRDRFEGLCVLSEKALVVDIPMAQHAGGLFSPTESLERSDQTAVFALTPEDAIAVIAQQSRGPILAVTTR